ncbi:MAG: CUAEP/CCAEP-tail radical SAM protein [Acidobacteriota bacterium]|nr:CUAEP/CCAEP-tail radical SAM protein [Acidobacteriota bacterium]
MRVVLLSTYDLGRQPFGLASPAAWLKRAGFEVTCVDLSRDKLSPDVMTGARFAAFYLPMHTATRLALPVIKRLKASYPALSIAAYGLYAPLNEALLREHGVSIVLGPESEQELVEAVGASGALGASGANPLPRLAFIQPDRTGLPALGRYASLRMPDGSRKVVGATDATRGCKHRCRHCPIVPVYDGQFRVVPIEVVMADVAALVAGGATHITFGDPDFFNGPTHARKLVEALHAAFPALTYDVIIKVEHLLQHRELLPVLARTGCLFVTSAVESVDDEVLAKLEKGHTRADFLAAAALCRAEGLTLVPTFVAFTPWTTLEGYRDLQEVVEAAGLTSHVSPIQWGIRLLVTWQSRLLELDDIQKVIGPFDQKTLTFPWRHPDPRVDELQQHMMELASAPRLRTDVPYLDEPWYC